MKEKIKEFLKSYLVGLILGIVVSGTIGVIAATYFSSGEVTYDNTESGLESTNVQGAIDELYGVCTSKPPGEQIIEDNGLEKDPYYVTFNNEPAGWRIISVGCDGTIKIVRTASIGNRAWDSSSSNWSRPATLNTYLNGTYLNSLSSEAQSQIVASDYSIGAVTDSNNDLADQVNDENSKTWNGKIALPTVSEYLRTNSNSNCKTFRLNNSNYITCRNTTWMHDSSNYWWTLSPYSGDSNYVFRVGGDGRVSNPAYITGYEVRPAITLSSEVQITGGTGTESDPYTLS